jgi:hypothetical protein
MAALNKDELFWMFQHEMNESLKRDGLPPRMVPNLGFLIKQPLGGQQKLDHMLHNRILEFMVALSSPTAHPYHLEQRIPILRLLLKHFSQLHKIFIAVFDAKYDNPKAFTIAWDRYVTLHCHPYEEKAKNNYDRTYPACEAEDICHLCALKWENTPNFHKQAHKCECCEMPEDDLLLSDISIYVPQTPNGSKDAHHNQHLWSFTASTSQLQDCLTPDTN